ncbi:terpene synthase family protein [Chitinophaga sp. RAB17]|uniref:terpene synthase family protein n=1 Tax=Chitinophaga sp. RAB17 TaxID=3233049 RepID=UPI003F93E0E7
MKHVASPSKEALIDISYPIHNLSSKHGEVMEQITRNWVDDYDCLPLEFKRKAKGANYGVLTAAVIPRAEIKVLVPITRWMLWAFCWDDYYGPYEKHDLKAICKTALKILRGTEEDEKYENDLFSQLAVIRQELGIVANSEWMRRFVASHVYYFQGLLMDTYSYKKNLKYPSSADYFKIRDRLIGGFMVMDLLELAGTIFPRGLFENPKIQKLRLLASRLMIYDNDLFSYKKEMKEGEAMNIVLVLQAEHKISLDEALIITLEMRQIEYLELLKFKKYFKEFGDYAGIVKIYWQNTMILLEGQLNWYKLMSKRYE